MGDRDDAVHIWKSIKEPTLLCGFGNMPCHGGRAVHARKHANIVPHPGTSLCAAKAHEGSRRLIAGNVWHRLRLAAEIGNLQVVNMHMGAGGDWPCRDTDHLTVFAHEL